jgi:hypothetical protein
MAPNNRQPQSNSWEPSTTIELLALLLTIPGAIAAIATFYILLSRHRQKRFSMSTLIPACSAPRTNGDLEKLKRARTM